MTKFIGVEYSRGATAKIINAGPALAPRTVQKMFPDSDWTIITPDEKSDIDCMADRFGDAFEVNKKLYFSTLKERHILIGGDHSVNFGHFTAIADQYPNEDLCLVYFDAHLDIHTPESSRKEASGAPHGTNVRHLLGEGDPRWLSLGKKEKKLKPENLFYFGSRSFEPSEIKYVKENNIFYRTPSQLQTKQDFDNAFNEVRKAIGNKKFIVSFDFDGIDANDFKDVWVPEPNGISIENAKYFIQHFADADSFEFVEYAVSGDKADEKTAKELIQIIADKWK